jgi:hypothetical protein
MASNDKEPKIMKVVPHGENGITYSIFSQLDTDEKVKYFIRHITWLDEVNKPIEKQIENAVVHLFPSFGRGQWGLGEPDVIILSDYYLFIIEVETESMEKLPGHFYKQFRNFIEIGNTLQRFKREGRKKISGDAMKFNDGKKVYGQYRTRKLIQDILNREKVEPYYINITNDHKKDGVHELSSIVNKLSGDIDLNFGWIGFNSIARFNHFEINNDLIRQSISYNLTK